MSNNLNLNFNMQDVKAAIHILNSYLDSNEAMLKNKNPQELMLWAHKLNTASVVAQGFSQKLKYFAKPHMIPPAWFSGQDDSFLKLHANINKIIKEQNMRYDGYKYNYGLPYQSLSILNIFGSRETEVRYDEYNLDSILDADDVILDIGANCGFMVIYSIFKKGCQGDCLDWNPYMLEIGEEVAKFLGFEDKIKFYHDTFQDWSAPRKYSVALSLASHWTTDEGLRLTLRDHMEKIYDILEPDGYLVFESQKGEHHNPDFENNINNIQDIFHIESYRVIEAWDRVIIILKKI